MQLHVHIPITAHQSAPRRPATTIARRRVRVGRHASIYLYITHPESFEELRARKDREAATSLYQRKTLYFTHADSYSIDA